jgi:hypothetical protein
VTDLGLAAHVDAVGVAVLLHVVHPVDVSFELSVGGGYAGRANELKSVTREQGGSRVGRRLAWFMEIPASRDQWYA